MKNKRTLTRLLVALAIVSAAAFAWVNFATHHTPGGQPPLVTLDAASLATFKEEFNRAAADTRLIVLLSPT